MTYTTATASVIGSSHHNLHYNNQDAYDLYQDRKIIVGVVADGCGSGINSEVGDGMYGLNDKEVVIEQHNRPHYVAKSLISGNAKIETDMIETNKLHHLFVATDGLLHLNDKLLRGEKVLEMTKMGDMFDNDDYFDDIVALPKDLTDLVLNKNILKDDSTLILLKKE